MERHLILFDCDGTLVDSHAHIIDSMQQAAVACDLPAPAPEAVAEIVGLSLERAIAVLFPDADATTHQRVIECYRQSYLRPGNSQPLYPGVVATLDILAARGYEMGIVTGKSRRGLNRVMEEHELRSWVAVSRTADECPSKPHPAMVTECADEMGMDTRHVSVVGDACFDMEMAVAAKARAIGVSFGAQPAARLVDAGAMCVVDRFNELLAQFPPLPATSREMPEGIREQS
jgi:phosphoglycolate phosphatase